MDKIYVLERIDGKKVRRWSGQQRAINVFTSKEMAEIGMRHVIGGAEGEVKIVKYVRSGEV